MTDAEYQQIKSGAHSPGGSQELIEHPTLGAFHLSMGSVLQEHSQRNWFAVLLCTVAGAFPIGIGLGVIPYDPAKIHAPPWVVVGAGIAFWFAGLLLLAKDKPRAANGIAFLLLLMFSAIGGWVSLFGEEGAFTDGANGALVGGGLTLARALFGLGALLCVLMALVALRRLIKKMS